MARSKVSPSFCMDHPTHHGCHRDIIRDMRESNQFLQFLNGMYYTEQILYNIKQEYKRMQKRRHLETSFQQTDPCCASEAQSHAFLLSGPASPGTSSATSSPLKKEQPLFTLRQVGMICERLLKEREEKVREEYEEILNTKLAEQYDAFVKFTHDQIMRRYGEQPASYVS
ncbi:akirin-2 isoform X2 [Tamandua tetradactyla]|uniref:akirin-2 isoform X2 n=1 Tax=Tamandua tetradactyla TaxID=48850 RepID=UPI004053B20E